VSVRHDGRLWKTQHQYGIGVRRKGKCLYPSLIHFTKPDFHRVTYKLKNDSFKFSWKKMIDKIIKISYTKTCRFHPMKTLFILIKKYEYWSTQTKIGFIKTWLPFTETTRSLHYSLTHSWSWALLEKLPIQSMPSHPISLRSILILSTHLRLGLPSGLFLSEFPTNILYAFFFSPIRATSPAHLIPFNLIILIILGEEYKLWRSLHYRCSKCSWNLSKNLQISQFH
jgi:hypothetical protein